MLTTPGKLRLVPTGVNRYASARSPSSVSEREGGNGIVMTVVEPHLSTLYLLTMIRDTSVLVIASVYDDDNGDIDAESPSRIGDRRSMVERVADVEYAI